MIVGKVLKEKCGLSAGEIVELQLTDKKSISCICIETNSDFYVLDDKPILEKIAQQEVRKLRKI